MERIGEKAYLVLENGRVFQGRRFGAPGELIKKCIQMDPDQRYDSVSSVKEELQRLLGWKDQKAAPRFWPHGDFHGRKKWERVVTVLGYCLAGLGIWKLIELGAIG